MRLLIISHIKLSLKYIVSIITIRHAYELCEIYVTSKFKNIKNVFFLTIVYNLC